MPNDNVTSNRIINAKVLKSASIITETKPWLSYSLYLILLSSLFMTASSNVTLAENALLERLPQNSMEDKNKYIYIYAGSNGAD